MNKEFELKKILFEEPRTPQKETLVSWYINLICYFNAKAILLEEQLWYYLTHSWEDKGVHSFPKGICPKVNVIALLEYELAYHDSTVHRFDHYTTRTPPGRKHWLAFVSTRNKNKPDLFREISWNIDQLKKQWQNQKHIRHYKNH